VALSGDARQLFTERPDVYARFIRLMRYPQGLRAVWRAETTTPADRKAMLRLVVQLISLEPVDLPRRGTRVRIQWMSGAVDEHIIDRPVNGTARRLAMRIQELLNSDAGIYGGSNQGNQGGVEAEGLQMHGRPYSLNLTLPGLSALFFKAPPGS